MGIKNSKLCGMCRLEVDSVEHLLLFCEFIKKLWKEISNWIIELGMSDYNLTDRKIIVGDLENALAINSIILSTKKVIYNIQYVKNEIKNFYFQEKYRHYTKGIRQTIYPTFQYI